MARPKHRTKPGATYFVTTDTWQRRTLFRKTTVANILETTLFAYRDRGFYFVHRYVIMPDHLHVILTPGATTMLEKAVQFLKGGSSHEIGEKLGTKFPVWHAGFTEHQIRDQADYDAHVGYIDMNPVKAGLACQPQDYPFCSAHGAYRHDPWPMPSGAKAPEKEAVITAGLKPHPSLGEARTRVNYFAYGSNLSRSQMERRVGSWHRARRAKLPNWTLVFNKARSDGSSAANIHHPGTREGVWGVVYEITKAQFDELATHEKGYRLEELEAVLEDGSMVTVHSFVAEADKVQKDVPPAPDYLRKILAGAEEHGLPEAHRSEIAKKARARGKGGVLTPPEQEQ